MASTSILLPHLWLTCPPMNLREEGLPGACCGVRLLGAAAAARDVVGIPLSPGDYVEYARDVATLRDQLGEEAFDAAWAEGRAMTLEQAIASALKETAH